MHSLLKGALVLAALVTAAPAIAQWYGPGEVAPPDDGYGYGYGPGYDYGPGYGYGPGNYGYGPGYYDYGPGYTAPPAAPDYEGRSEAAAPDNGPDGSVAYCEQRFRSYDPTSGTYLGYDGMRHSCP